MTPEVSQVAGIVAQDLKLIPSGSLFAELQAAAEEARSVDDLPDWAIAAWERHQERAQAERDAAPTDDGLPPIPTAGTDEDRFWAEVADRQNMPDAFTIIPPTAAVQ